MVLLHLSHSFYLVQKLMQKQTLNVHLFLGNVKKDDGFSISQLMEDQHLPLALIDSFNCKLQLNRNGYASFYWLLPVNENDTNTFIHCLRR